jgi:hypothetical protein
MAVTDEVDLRAQAAAGASKPVSKAPVPDSPVPGHPTDVWS